METTERPYPFHLVEPLVSLHSHLRELLEVMEAAIENLAQGGADVILGMPNTAAGLKKWLEVFTYTQQAQQLVKPGRKIHFIPTAMITEDTTVKDILDCVANDILDFKVYPRYRTTNSENGVVRYWRVIDIIREAARQALARFGKAIRVHLHLEHPCMTFMSRDAEFVMIPVALMLLEETDAIIFWEHGSDARCIPFWKEMATKYPGRFYVTLTAHHLVTNEDKAFGDVNSVCKPPIKTETDRERFIELIEEDHDWVLAGPDDAPHPDERPSPGAAAKHVHDGQCACGAYTAPYIMALYAHALKRLLSRPGGVEVFINFTSRNARKVYSLAPPTFMLKLIEKQFHIPGFYLLGPWRVEPFWALRPIDFTVEQAERTQLN